MSGHTAQGLPAVPGVPVRLDLGVWNENVNSRVALSTLSTMASFITVAALLCTRCSASGTAVNSAAVYPMSAALQKSGAGMAAY